MQELRRAVAIRYGCTCVHVASAPVKETFHKEMAWDGEVEVFDLMGHRTTKIEVLIHPHTGTVWIAWLHIAFSFRSAGLGRQLVRAAEGIAYALGLCVVNVFPLYGSHPFWLKLGYQSHPYTSRVLCKHLPAPLCQRTIRSGNEKNGRRNIMAPKSV